MISAAFTEYYKSERINEDECSMRVGVEKHKKV
jgi:hypothetical protein